MKTAGNLIRETRLKLNLSRNELGEMTHIKTGFIKAIENSDWENLPELAVLIGFVKSIAHFLNIDDNVVVALLRREYKPLSQKGVKPKTKELGKKIVWGPRLTFLTAIAIITLIIASYLGLQYKKFNSHPILTVNSPQENELVKGLRLDVSGKTDPDATIEVNNQPVIVERSGDFQTELDVTGSTNEIKITAKSRSGKETIISRTIKVIK